MRLLLTSGGITNPSIEAAGKERWEPWVREADALLVDGGDATYLAHWMRESGLG